MAASGRTAVQNAALWIGVIFLLIGIAGFIPGVTSDYDQMAFAGAESGAMLLGIFQVSILHNIVHLLFGVWGLAAARSFSGSRVFLIGGGLIYGLLWVYGLVVDEASSANFVPLNNADNWLHLALFVLMVALGAVLGSENRRPVAAPSE
jgi:4-hydroxybenzoate polyprenyltransferase